MVRIDHNGQEPAGPPTEERGAPPIPHDGHFRVAILRGLGVVEDALAVALQPPPGIVVDQLEPLSDRLRM
jgi:hypothetical protein